MLLGYSTRKAAARSVLPDLQTNAGGPLLIEHSVSVPDAIRADSKAEITRLSAVAGADPLVKICLMKASYLYCVAAQVRWMVIGARNEALIRQYRRLGFADAFDDEWLVPLLHAGRLGHRVLTLNVTAVERTWLEKKHALYSFFFDTLHPDIQLFSTQPALPVRASRSADRSLESIMYGRAQQESPLARTPSVRSSVVQLTSPAAERSRHRRVRFAGERATAS